MSENWCSIWARVYKAIRETIYVMAWSNQDLECPEQEQSLLRFWYNPNIFAQQTHRMPISPPTSDTCWSPPPIGFIKLNFYGASKRNLGLVGYGGIFRNSQGEILYSFVGSLGWEMNNAAEIWALYYGLTLSIQHQFFPLMVEGESQIIIQLFKKLLNGFSAFRISPN